MPVYKQATFRQMRIFKNHLKDAFYICKSSHKKKKKNSNKFYQPINTSSSFHGFTLMLLGVVSRLLGNGEKGLLKAKKPLGKVLKLKASVV